jgi:hypothetical protein
MLKMTSLAIGLLTVMAIAPNAQALNVNVNNQATQHSNKNLQAQITVILGGQPEYHNNEYHGNNNYEYRRRRAAELRRLELERQRAEEKRRYEYRNRSHHGGYQQQVNNGHGGYNNDHHGRYNNSKEYTDYR